MNAYYPHVFLLLIPHFFLELIRKRLNDNDHYASNKYFGVRNHT